MLNYLKKFTLEILPSVAATIIGAYIVNHYISKPAVNAPAAAVVSPAEKKINAKPADDVANIPEPGVKAKGISERGMIEKSASEKPAEVKPAEIKATDIKPADIKPAETKPSETKPSETASIPPAEQRKHAPAPKAVARTIPAPIASPAAPTETAAVPAEDHRDANELARAAIERLRGTTDGQPRSQEASRVPDAPRLQEAPRAVVPNTAASIRPLPPPIAVTAPPVEVQGNTTPYTASIRNDDPNRPTPPAEIPPPPPIDLQADASKLAARTHNMAQDVLARTKSMFHALLPNNSSSGNSGQSSSASQFTE
jgi:hypothetical protein